MAKLQIWNFYSGHQGYQNGVEGFWDGPNSAGGVSVRISFKNNTEKAIKYAIFRFTPYNRVGDRQCCRIKGISEAELKYTGPLEPNCIASGVMWENVWYNNAISNVKLSTRVWVQYMDGTSEDMYEWDVDFSKPKGACYVATSVYGSYDCPQVWTLRRYRDQTLAETWYGRLFIKTYYAVSPTLVKWFGETKWFKKLWKGKLDRMVADLQAKGVESTPYEDKEW